MLLLQRSDIQVIEQRLITENQVPHLQVVHRVNVKLIDIASDSGERMGVGAWLRSPAMSFKIPTVSVNYFAQFKPMYFRSIVNEGLTTYTSHSRHRGPEAKQESSLMLFCVRIWHHVDGIRSCNVQHMKQVLHHWAIVMAHNYRSMAPNNKRTVLLLCIACRIYFIIEFTNLQ